MLIMKENYDLASLEVKEMMIYIYHDRAERKNP